MPAGTARSEALRTARQDKFDQWFRFRRWRVAAEITEIREIDGDRVVYDHGEFWVDKPGVFQTPLGHKGRHGFVVCEVDAVTGLDLQPLVQAAFGYASLQRAQEEYGAVRDLTEPRDHPPA